MKYVNILKINWITLIVIVIGIFYQIDAMNSDLNVNSIQYQHVADKLLNLLNENKIRNKRTIQGFYRNSGRNYGRNTWLQPSRRPATNGLFGNRLVPQNSGLNSGLNGFGTDSLWNRLTTVRPSHPVVNGNNDEVDPAVAQKFPGLVNLLNNLKELNKLKDEGKLPIGSKPAPDQNNNKPNEDNQNNNKPNEDNQNNNKPNGNNQNNNKPNGSNQNNNKHYGNNQNKPNENHDQKNNGTTEKLNNKCDGENKDSGDTIITWTVVSGGKVYFQAQPVVPANEEKKINETIYYVKS